MAQYLTDERLRELMEQADACSENRIPALIQQLSEKIERLDEVIDGLGKRTIVDDQAVQS